MSEETLLELVPKFRQLLDLGGGEGAAVESELGNLKNLLEEMGDSVSGDLKLSFDSIKEDLVFEDGTFKVRDESLSNQVTTLLNKGDLSTIYEMGGVEINAENKELIEVFRRITSDIPERRLEEILVESQEQYSAISSEESTLQEINRNVDNTVENQKIIEGNSKLNSVNEFFNTVKNVGSIVVTGGIVIALGVSLASYIKNYIQTKSGAFLVTTGSQGEVVMQKIIKYSCLYPQQAVIVHPFDAEITAYLKGVSPCADTATYGPCGGWATIGGQSRLAKAGIDVSKLASNKTLKCVTATAYDAIFDLGKTFLKDVADLVKNAAGGIADIFWKFIKPFAPLIAAFVGLVAGGITYWVTSSLGTWPRLGVAALIAIILAVLSYYIIQSVKFSSSTKSSADTPVETTFHNPSTLLPNMASNTQYYECPSCRKASPSYRFPRYTVYRV